VTGYMPRWFTRPQTVIHSSTNRAAHCRELITSVTPYKYYTIKPRLGHEKEPDSIKVELGVDKSAARLLTLNEQLISKNA